MFEVTDYPNEKAAFYRLLNQQATALISGEEDAIANLANISSLLYLSMRDVNWVGFYIVRGDTLVLGPFQGKPACTRIPVGRGVCGTAAAQKTTQLVDDVLAFPGHIACDADSRSELVIPVMVDGVAVAVLDIDSPNASRFDLEDQAGLEGLVSLINKAVNFKQLT
ncbi:GAF domain-containing protein [uncultured Endozoicomonas sp.]|uniref:GAF domain-containing protein n=1 Tax=uncultured Endozoicomonas sp. TaxID=432652 RepID=UPI00262697BA|nr:GAF domain-containing protein [uncultured Endozoicomonas sp.]